MQNENATVIYSQVKSYLEQALPEVNKLIKQRFAEAEGVPESGKDLDRNGLRNGSEIVEDYMNQNEWGLALEHLCYMIEETGLPIPAETYLSIKAAAHAMHVDVLRQYTMP